MRLDNGAIFLYIQVDSNITLCSGQCSAGGVSENMYSVCTAYAKVTSQVSKYETPVEPMCMSEHGGERI